VNQQHQISILSSLGIEACVIVEGCPIKDSTPPKDSAKVNNSVLLTTFFAILNHLQLNVKEIIPPKSFIWFLAIS
jgi:hypothetical protein